jgi:hypothetical protein
MFADSMTRGLSLIGLVACGACAGNSAPQGWLPPAAEAQATAYGGWIELTYRDANGERRSQGELIAVTADSVWVLEGNGGKVVPTAMVKSGKLTGYASRKGTLAAWTALGTLATLSNGVVLVGTAPMWLIGGSLATASESRAPVRESPPLSWVELAPFARFPQGMPAGIELGALHPKVIRQQPE